ncbi:MAG: hypothetical protein NVS3B20_04760 [Polyangiales bacterium]
MPFGPFTNPARHVWGVSHVTDNSGPACNVRNYLEHRDLRRCLREATWGATLGRACEVGCGYGRVIMVLEEFAREVVGFEREEHLLADARKLLPTIRFEKTDDLGALDAPDGSFEFAMTFTVLQHLGEGLARRVLGELKRLVPKGHILLVEETDVAIEEGNRAKAEAGYTTGRSVETYVEWMKPYRLVTTFPRQIEPGYPRANVGAYMLFSS